MFTHARILFSKNKAFQTELLVCLFVELYKEKLFRFLGEDFPSVFRERSTYLNMLPVTESFQKHYFIMKQTLYTGPLSGHILGIFMKRCKRISALEKSGSVYSSLRAGCPVSWVRLFPKLTQLQRVTCNSPIPATIGYCYSNDKLCRRKGFSFDMPP